VWYSNCCSVDLLQSCMVAIIMLASFCKDERMMMVTSVRVMSQRACPAPTSQPQHNVALLPELSRQE
jgi:hypothetical protein